jgi:propionyl-CoA synthetase
MKFYLFFYERTIKYIKVTMRHISEFTVSDHQVSKLAGALAKMGVSRGDRVLVYMPMIPEAIISMLAAVRLGAVHSVVFGGMICFDLFCNH